jgi:hypothetical protein
MDVLDVADVFLPLRCAMANNGACNLPSLHRDLAPVRKVHTRPLMAAVDLG